MLLKLYVRFSPILAAFLALTSAVFFCMCVWRGEIILGLQAEASKDNTQEIRVVLEQHDAANQISDDAEKHRIERSKEKEVAIRTIEKIVTVPLYSGLCFDDIGVQQLNDQIAALNGSSEPVSRVSKDTGVE